MIKTIIDNNTEYTYEVNYGSLEAINKFKAFVGKDKFDEIVNGMGFFDLPFEEDKYEELLKIIITKLPEQLKDYSQVPFHHAGELAGFFCEPFAGRSLKQAKSTMTTISSLLRDTDLELVKTMMESTLSRKKNGTDTGVAN